VVCSISYAGLPSRGNVIRNNIFYNNDIDNGYQIDYELHNPPEEGGNKFQYNLFYKSGVNDVIYYEKESPYTFTVAEFNAMDGDYYNDSIRNNIQADPRFEEALNYHIQDTSQAVGAGTTPLSLTDYVGTTWTAPYNMGVYEAVESTSGVIRIRLKSGGVLLKSSNGTILY